MRERRWIRRALGSMLPLLLAVPALSKGKPPSKAAPAAVSSGAAPIASETPPATESASASAEVTAEPAPPSAAPAVGAKATTPSVASASDEATSSPPVFAPIVVRLFGFGASRSFYYSGRIQGSSSDRVPGYYSLPGAPGAGLRLDWFPLAHGRHRRVMDPGITGTYRREALVTKTAYPDSDAMIQAWEWQAGLVLRAPAGPHELGLSATYGMHAFLPGDPATAGYLPVPGVDWSFVRVGVSGRFALPAFFVGVGAGYRIVLNETGGLVSDEWYSSLRASGFDVELELGVPLSRAFDLSAGVELRRYTFSGPVPKRDTHGTGALFGGVDLHAAGFGMLTWKIGG